MKIFHLLFLLLFWNISFGQVFNELCDEQTINQYILKEVNRYRKKAKVPQLYIDPLLRMAADDHCLYMCAKDKLTHFQKIKYKKTPKNRVDYYGEQFASVGENVQQTYLNIEGQHEIKNCSELAKILVKGWKNSPPHYANMISEEFTTTYTAVNINGDGKVYACQLFGSDAFKNAYKDSMLYYNYKAYKEKRCRRCERKMLHGSIYLTEDSTIVFAGTAPFLKGKFLKRGIRFNWFHYGLAADIVLKEQYDCDTNIVFNGKTAVRGIPLEPVFKKDFRKGPNVWFWKWVSIELGKVPEWVDQDFEVNLTYINNKRTCMNVLFNVVPAEFHLDLEYNLYLDSLDKFYQVPVSDTLKYKLTFEKSDTTAADSLMRPISKFVNTNYDHIKQIQVLGRASIEGKTESNMLLYKSRANVITDRLNELGIDDDKIIVSAEENFKDFRRDIVDTEFEYLLDSSDAALKRIVNGNTEYDFEPILACHRYAQILIVSNKFEKRKFHKDTVYTIFRDHVERMNIHGAKRMQSVEYALALDKEISLGDIKSFKIKNSEKWVDLLCDRYLMIYHLDSLNQAREQVLADSLKSLKRIDPKNERVNTTSVMLKYPNWFGLKYKAARKYFDTLSAERYMDEKIQARMILNFAAHLDVRTFNKGRKNFLYHRVKRYVKPAKLNVQETFDLASYYAFFEDYHYAYQLTKRLVFRSEDSEEIVFFLKLIYYLDPSVSKKTAYKYFKRIAKNRGEEFCTYFNSPRLNFQILDDPEIREIYCETCN